MTVRTEELLTSPHGFGLATATPAQRAACRILDGLPLGELRTHPDVVALVGGEQALSELSSERGIKPTELVLLAAARCAKTKMAAACAVRASQTVDVSRLGHGEIARISIVSLDLDKSAVAFRMLHDTVAASKALKPLLIQANADALLLRHPSGRPIEVKCVAAAKAGGGLVARWSASVIYDEAPRMASERDGVINLDDARAATLSRLLPGAQALYIGSPWAPHGTIYDFVDQFWQKPTEHMVVLRGNGPALNPEWWNEERCRKIEQQNPVTYRTEVCGDFADPEAGLLNPAAIFRSTRDAPVSLPFERGVEYFAAVDPSEGGARGNAWALVIVSLGAARDVYDLGDHPAFRRRVTTFEEQPKFRVVHVQEWRGYTPAECWKEIARVCKRYGVRTCRTDQYAASANTDLAAIFGLRLDIDRATAPSKLEDFTNLQTLLSDGRIELSPDPVLRRDLLSVKRRVTQQGATIVLPRTGDGRHSDYAAALCAAIKAAANPPQEITPLIGRIPGL